MSPPSTKSSRPRKKSSRRSAGRTAATQRPRARSSFECCARRSSRRTRTRRSARSSCRKPTGSIGNIASTQNGTTAHRSMIAIGCRAKRQRAPAQQPAAPAAGAGASSASSSPRPSGATTSRATYSTVKRMATRPSIGPQPPHSATVGSDSRTKKSVESRITPSTATCSSRADGDDDGRFKRSWSFALHPGCRTNGRDATPRPLAGASSGCA